MTKPEILAPVGNFEMLSAAINAKADAIYFGVRGLNMRAGASNFDLKEIEEIVFRCHDNNVKAYLCINTIIFEEETEKIHKILKEAKRTNIDAIICWDLSVLKLARDLDLEVHLSTQASSANSIAINEFKKMGVSRVVLARECSLNHIKKIKENTNVEIEVFIHGAMCVAVSGRCFMSENLYGKSANRGECIQPCRRSYNIQDPETHKELELSNHFVMSPKDMCTIDIIDKILDTGVSCMKIEGRNRSPEYVKNVVEVYRTARNEHLNGTLTKQIKSKLKERLKEVYNRDFSDGFFMGKPIGEWCDTYGSKSKKVKQFIGTVVNYFKKPQVAEIKLNTGKLSIGDTILIIGPTTGCIEHKCKSMQINDKNVESIKKGESVGIKIDTIVRKNDQVYIWQSR